MTLEQLEALLITHLQESGTIKTDIQHLKEMSGRIEGRMWAAAASSILTLLAVAGFLLKVAIWK